MTMNVVPGFIETGTNNPFEIKLGKKKPVVLSKVLFMWKGSKLLQV